MCQKELTIEEIRKFSKLSKLPIPYYSPKTIMYYLAKLEKFYPGCVQLFEQYKKYCHEIHHEKGKTVSHVTDSIVYKIKNNEEIKNMLKDNTLIDWKNTITKKTTIYEKQNIGKY